MTSYRLAGRWTHTLIKGQAMIFLITNDDIGRNGLTKRDIGKFCFMDFVSKVFYVRKTRAECEELRILLSN
jgi:hypothetical protein